MGTQSSAILHTEMQSSSKLAEGVAKLPDNVTDLSSADQPVSASSAEGLLSESQQPSAMLSHDMQSRRMLAAEAAHPPDSVTHAAPASQHQPADTAMMPSAQQPGEQQPESMVTKDAEIYGASSVCSCGAMAVKSISAGADLCFALSKW